MQCIKKYELLCKESKIYELCIHLKLFVIIILNLKLINLWFNFSYFKIYS